MDLYGWKIIESNGSCVIEFDFAGDNTDERVAVTSSSPAFYDIVGILESFRAGEASLDDIMQLVFNSTFSREYKFGAGSESTVQDFDEGDNVDSRNFSSFKTW